LLQIQICFHISDFDFAELLLGHHAGLRDGLWILAESIIGVDIVKKHALSLLSAVLELELVRFLNFLSFILFLRFVILVERPLSKCCQFVIFKFDNFWSLKLLEKRLECGYIEPVMFLLLQRLELAFDFVRLIRLEAVDYPIFLPA